MSNHRPLLTIGYGNRSVDEFVSLLHAFDVKFLGDVRSRPYSSFAPDFSRETLAEFLRQVGISYVFLGDALGGNPDNPETWELDPSGTRHFVNYDKVQQLGDFKKGIARLEQAWIRNVGLALMCSEAKPEICHRVRLIGTALSQSLITVMHIDEVGSLRSQEDIMLRLQKGQSRLPGMLDDPRAMRSPKSFS